MKEPCLFVVECNRAKQGFCSLAKSYVNLVNQEGIKYIFHIDYILNYGHLTKIIRGLFFPIIFSNQPTNQPINQSINQPTNQQIEQNYYYDQGVFFLLISNAFRNLKQNHV